MTPSPFPVRSTAPTVSSRPVRAWSACVSAMVLLAGCGGADTRNTAAATAGPANGDTVANRIAAMNEGERNATLFRAIRDAGRDCQGVTRSVPTEPLQGRPAWIATCDNHGEWLIAIAANGTAIVTNGHPAG